ncbi:MAG: amidohydrolase family protein [Oscillospiraceae bacterium]|nr:amidohydrolase family protein [Oscillospiraceae bacterium]
MSYKIFDAHTHCFPDAVARRAVTYLAEKASIPCYTDGTFGGLCEYERKAAGFCLLPIATKPAQTRSINRFSASLHGKRGAVALGSIHPASEDIAGELDELCALGLKGLKLHPEYQEFFVDDPAVFPLYREIFGRGLIVHFHAGQDIGFAPPVRGAADRIAKVCDAFPEATVIAAHLGSFQQWDLVSQHLAGRRNLYIDTSFAADWMDAARFRALVRLHGADRVLFGTDAPWSDFDGSYRAVLCSGLDEAELRAVFWDNAAELYGL